jgi:hypothetical protein
MITTGHSSLSEQTGNRQYFDSSNQGLAKYKRRKRNNKNISLNKVAIDSGYPQDIFTRLTPHKNHDYLEENKNSLKRNTIDRVSN